MLLMAMAGITSCVSDSDSETTVYSDGAITSFALGTMNQYLHTISSTGADSIYKKTFTGSSYAFHIDQMSHTIFNTDSLPIGTDVAHVLVTLASKNNGTVLIQSEEDENVFSYYSSTDSIDFTNPRKFFVYSSDNSGAKTEYTVKLNVHQEEANTFVWHQLQTSEILKTLSNVEAQYWKGEIYISGEIDNQQKVYKVDKNGVLTEYSSYEKEMPEGIKKWIGTTSKEVYALSTDNRLMVSRDDGMVFVEDTLDDELDKLPIQDIAFVSYPLEYATNTEYAIMVGNRSPEKYPQENIAMVWRKIIDNDEYSPKGVWTCMDHAANNWYALPRMENIRMVAYDDGILAIGGEVYGDETSAPYADIYQSRDDGITWKTTSAYQMPEGFDSNATSVGMVVDNDKCLWLFCGSTGQIWRGRLNKMAWTYKD